MRSFSDTLRKVQSEELLSRFRSKDDIYKYMTQHMGLFLPSQTGTRLSFIRAILSNQKRALKSNEIIVTQVPQYEELSVKNLYPDAMRDQIVSQYLPELEQNSNRLPERNFFFGILSTLKNDYLKSIIEEANLKRYQSQYSEQQENYIVIDENWYDELIKHPFLSKKPGKAIHLIKKRSKLIRSKRNQQKFELSQRMSSQYDQNEEGEISDFSRIQKRQKTQQFQNNSLINNEEKKQLMHFNI